MEADDRKERFIALLGEHLGNVARVCAEMGIPRVTYYRWRKKDETFAATCDLIIESHKASRHETATARYTEHDDADERDEPELTLEPEKYSGDSAEAIAKAHSAFLRSCLKDSGLYSLALEAQILSAARLYASLQIMFSEVDRFAPVLTEMSREGNPRLVSNPIHEMIRRHTDTYNATLKALGLNFDSKAKQKEEDGMADFFKRMEEDD